MIELYDKLKAIAESEYEDIVTSTKILGKRTLGSAKLRIFFKDVTYLDVWIGPSGKYSYHWEQRAQRGTIYRHDNAPDFPRIKTYPQHLHDGNERNIQPSYVDTNPTIAIKQVLTTIKQRLEEASLEEQQ